MLESFHSITWVAAHDAVDDCSERDQVMARNSPDEVCVNAMICVSKPIAEISHSPPVDVSFASL